ncbi:MAG: tetratricopeptide repeat protein [Elusimicrobiota bacterium]
MRKVRPFAAVLLSVLFSGCAGNAAWKRDAEIGDRALRHGRLPESEVALIAALARAEAFGDDDPRLASALNALGDLRAAQGAPARAEPLYRRALTILEKTAGPDDPETTAALAYLAEACAAQGKSAEAEKLLRRALASAKKDPARRVAEISAREADLAALERGLGRDDLAVASYRRALAATE